MSALTDFLAWQANVPDEDKVSLVPTIHQPMSAGQFQELHDGTIVDMNRRAMNNSGNVVLQTGFYVATSLGRNGQNINNK